MLYRKTTPSYNQRRYGKPWIAVLDFSAPGKPVYTFGNWLGSQGDSGELSIDVNPGDVLAVGQKDYRKGRGGPDKIGVVQSAGSVEWGFTLAAARDEGQAVRDELAETAANPEASIEIFDPCM